MLDYRCPTEGCRKLLFRANGPLVRRIELPCKGCGQIVAPERADSPMHRTYRCTGCGRTQHCERPKHDRTYCIVCGTATLVIVAETGRKIAGRPEHQEATVPR